MNPHIDRLTLTAEMEFVIAAYPLKNLFERAS